MKRNKKAHTREAKMDHAVIEEAAVPLEFDSPESSIIEGARYDEGQRVLTVFFKRSNPKSKEQAYRYGGVTPQEWAAFAQSFSKGKHFSEHIRTQFKGTAV